MRYSKELRRYISEGARRRANLRWAKDRERRATTVINVDADTLRSRALFDRKGLLIVSGISIHHSTNRSDQFDLFIDGSLAVTGGPRVIAKWLAVFSESTTQI